MMPWLNGSWEDVVIHAAALEQLESGFWLLLQ